MKKLIHLTAIAALAAPGISSAQPAYSTPAGYVTIPIPGTGGVGTQKIQIANQGLLPSDSLKYAGVAEAITSTYIQDDDGTWTAGDYVTAGSVGAMVSHLVEITNGPLQGSMTWITSSDDTQGAGQRLYTSDDISSAGSTASFRVLKTFTIATLLGNPPAAAVMGGGGTITTADNIQILDPLGAPTTFWYKNAGGSPATWGWKSAGIANADVPLTAIHPNDGLAFFRKQSADGSLVIPGTVKTGNTNVRVEGGTGTVFNVIAIQIPVDSLTIADSGLYTGDPATGIKGAGTITAADAIKIWDPVTGSFTTFWYKNAGGSPATWGWKASGLSVPPVPAEYVIPSDRAVVIARKDGAAFTWNVPAGYTPAP